MLKVGCTHGKKFEERCIDCELVYEREMIAIAERRVAEGKARIQQLVNEQRWDGVAPLHDSREWFYPGEATREVR